MLCQVGNNFTVDPTKHVSRRLNMQWTIDNTLKHARLNSLTSVDFVREHVVLLRMDFEWWRHQMQSFFVLLALCEGNPPVTGGFSSQRTNNEGFCVFFDVSPSKRLKKSVNSLHSITFWKKTEPLTIATGLLENSAISILLVLKPWAIAGFQTITNWLIKVHHADTKTSFWRNCQHSVHKTSHLKSSFRRNFRHWLHRQFWSCQRRKCRQNCDFVVAIQISSS